MPLLLKEENYIPGECYVIIEALINWKIRIFA